ncbi:glycerol-3-phosphate phosphatase-like [Wyeomyia smithii]|uniref:glycerol-3-phosphate phosphatase-like n=1 Tax=Wyeomyia smithii TaxID=174621 RepID=UPI002468063F|nr:glycerol-3-phosphate phosphatase-like [Wyeomyia smithii]XP_055529555.1 glycerol-3-phosphate phosphatase-like [Wyeomyia smithii]XP_055529556.1 glycerol-3-phosphate phosphatase-like [Wyeomyia smithii]XP_055529557.1 glycerol-3-phosphate phosphatase-like [Wyeomyia smithii]
MEKGTIRHLLELSLEEKRAFLKSFDMIMSDCDGVVWNFTGPIPGVDKALQLLKDNGKRLAFISNNGMRTMAEYMDKFNKLGIEPEEHDIVHPALTTVKYLKSINMQDAVYCIATEVFKDYLRDAGFVVLDGPNEHIADERVPNGVRIFSEYFSQHEGPKVGAVVVDIDVNISLAHMMKAKCYMHRNRNCLLIAGATDHIIPLDSSMDVIGPGYFIEILERTCGRKALVLGKPGQALSEFILEQFHVTQPERTLFIGDMLPQDMGFGTRCGFQKILMLSGGTTKEMLMTHTKPEELPNYYADSFADFIQLYNDVAKK